MSLADSIKDIAPCGQHSFNTPYIRSVFVYKQKSPVPLTQGMQCCLRIFNSANS